MKNTIEQGEPIAYLKFYAKQWLVSPEIGMDGCEGLEVCGKDEIGDDGLPAFAVYTIPQQPQSVADALEEAANICDEEAAEWSSDNVITNKNYAEVCSRRIRALIKRNAEPKECKLCSGQGHTETGIDESPTTICNNCDGIGTITPKEGE